MPLIVNGNLCMFSKYLFKAVYTEIFGMFMFVIKLSINLFSFFEFFVVGLLFKLLNIEPFLVNSSLLPNFQEY